MSTLRTAQPPDHDPPSLLRAAVAAYLVGPRPQHPDEMMRTLTMSLDHAMGLAHRWGEDELAACLLVLALARPRRGLGVCARALRHALAELAIDLPARPSPHDPDA